jgi:hypothetical protein
MCRARFLCVHALVLGPSRLTVSSDGTSGVGRDETPTEAEPEAPTFESEENDRQ